jgi:hypothetical protein
VERAALLLTAREVEGHLSEACSLKQNAVM